MTRVTRESNGITNTLERLWVKPTTDFKRENWWECRFAAWRVLNHNMGARATSGVCVVLSRLFVISDFTYKSKGKQRLFFDTFFLSPPLPSMGGDRRTFNHVWYSFARRAWANTYLYVSYVVVLAKQAVSQKSPWPRRNPTVRDDQFSVALYGHSQNANRTLSSFLYSFPFIVCLGGREVKSVLVAFCALVKKMFIPLTLPWVLCLRQFLPILWVSHQ